MLIKIALLSHESAKKASNAMKSCAFAIPVCKKSIPKNKKPKPAKIVPYVLYWRGAIICTNTPIPIIGNENVAKLTLKPINEMIQPVLVLPILAPIIKPIDCTNDKSPALTKPIVIKDVAVEDWMRTVMMAPVIIEDMVPPVKRFSSFLKESPAIASNPSAIKFMPNRKNPIPPIAVAIPTMSSTPSTDTVSLIDFNIIP